MSEEVIETERGDVGWDESSKGQIHEHTQAAT